MNTAQSLTAASPDFDAASKAMLEAAAIGDTAECIRLLDAGANINTFSKKGQSALELAIRAGAEGLGLALVARGIQLDSFDPANPVLICEGISVLHLASAQNVIPFASGGIASRPAQAVKDQSMTRLVTALLDADMRVDDLTDQGHTPLHWAAEEDRVDVIEILLGRGAEINARAANGMTPLHIAVARGAWDAAEALVRLGADLEARCSKGRTPLFCAVGADSTEMTEILIALGADMATRDNEGQSLLALCTMEARRCQALVLLAYGAGPAGDSPFFEPTSMRQAAASAGLIDRLGHLLDNEPAQCPEDELPELLKRALDPLQPGGGGVDQGVVAYLQSRLASQAIDAAMATSRGAVKP